MKFMLHYRNYCNVGWSSDSNYIQPISVLLTGPRSRKMCLCVLSCLIANCFLQKVSSLGLAMLKTMLYRT